MASRRLTSAAQADGIICVCLWLSMTVTVWEYWGQPRTQNAVESVYPKSMPRTVRPISSFDLDHAGALQEFLFHMYTSPEVSRNQRPSKSCARVTGSSC